MQKQTNLNNVKDDQSLNDDALRTATLTKAGGLITKELVARGKKILQEQKQ